MKGSQSNDIHWRKTLNRPRPFFIHQLPTEARHATPLHQLSDASTLQPPHYYACCHHMNMFITREHHGS